MAEMMKGDAGWSVGERYSRFLQIRKRLLLHIFSFKANVRTLKNGTYQLDFLLPYSRKRMRLRYESYEEALEAQKTAELRFNPTRRKE